MKSAWDVILDDETYLLLEEWYGRKINLSIVIQNMNREGIIRLLDGIIEDATEFGEDEMLRRAKTARENLLGGVI